MRKRCTVLLLLALLALSGSALAASTVALAPTIILHDGPMPLCPRWVQYCPAVVQTGAVDNLSARIPIPPEPVTWTEGKQTRNVFDPDALLLADAPPVGQPPPGKCCFETKYGPYCCN